ncbi:hypothetical protein ACLOJK_001915 [Asimina triloba]
MRDENGDFSWGRECSREDGWNAENNGGQHCLAPKGRHFKILSFKGNDAHNEESEGTASASKFSKNSVKLSYVPQKEETDMESQDRPNGRFSYTSAQTEETVGGSATIQEMFKKWLIILRTQTASRTVEEVLKESPSKTEVTDPQPRTHGRGGAGDLLKALLHFYLGLNAAINVPPLIMLPLYVAVNVACGPEVSRELTPLWVIGPFVIALYVKAIQRVVGLYIFSFHQTIRLVKNIPTMTTDLLVRLWQPVVRMRDLNWWKEALEQKKEEMREGVVEWYLDVREANWPLYCKIMGFLKRSNLI